MQKEASTADIDLDRDIFLRNLVRHLAGTLQDVVGLRGAEGYVSTVGARIGEWINDEYRDNLGVAELTPQQVADVCVDLKARIGGEFRLESMDSDKMVFVNSACPFGDRVADRPSLCMMTSNVFGRIAADNLGYARVELAETIAEGHAGCRVVVHLSPYAEAEPEAREYYRAARIGRGDLDL